MPLSEHAALAKDRRTTTKLQHRHFAEIARIIAGMPDASARELAADQFWRELRRSNPNFDGQRFLRACRPEDQQ